MMHGEHYPARTIFVNRIFHTHHRHVKTSQENISQRSGTHLATNRARSCRDSCSFVKSAMRAHPSWPALVIKIAHAIPKARAKIPFTTILCQ
jgi:hypothetical protein